MNVAYYASKSSVLNAAGWIFVILSVIIGGALGATHQVVEIDTESAFGGTTKSFNWSLAFQAFGPLFVGGVIMLAAGFILDEMHDRARAAAASE